VRETLSQEVKVLIAMRSELHQVCGDSQALGGRAKLYLAEEKQEAVEKLRASAQHQPAVRASRLLGFAA
jgi:hypothetical protein